jgi:3',5'-cyclic AMP phosphodiesterase CpdA
LRIIHLSDIHVWRYTFNPLKLASKRAIGIMSLAAGRAGRFRLERLRDVVDRVLGLGADHLVITGDLTTTALPAEFREAREALAGLLVDSSRVTVVPGNHDRYTSGSVQYRAFEEWFGAFMPAPVFPWVRRIDADTAILGLDATRSHISATGRLPEPQLVAARRLVADAGDTVRRWIVACHYPVAAPPAYEHELSKKRMKNAAEVAAWLGGIGPHLFCCGHVHAAWAFLPRDLPGQLCLNAGAPLLRDPTGLRPPGFLELTLHDRDVSAVHHAWVGTAWETRALYQNPGFFAPAARQGIAAAP